MMTQKTSRLLVGVCMWVGVCVLWSGAGVRAAAAADAQSELEAVPATRDALLRQERAAKAKHLHPFVPDRLESISTEVETQLLPRIFTPKTGFYPRFGSITQGGGFSLGPGYRVHSPFGQEGDLFVSGAYSIKQYWIGEARLVLPQLVHKHVFGEAYIRRTSFPRQGFYGLGIDTTKAGYASFALNETTLGGNVGVRPARWIAVGGGAEYLDPGIGRGRSPGFPSIEQSYTDQTAPGLASQPDFVRTFGFVNVDYAEPIGSPRDGGRYRVTVSRYSDRDAGRFDFTETHVDLQQYLSAFNGKRVLALRAVTTLTDADNGADVPFYLMGTLGGNNTLRGYRDFRFRDRNLVLLQAEYRFEVFTAMDGALFYDAGQVAPRRQDFSFDRFRKDYGIGLRFGTNLGVFIRIDLAFGGSEGARPFVAFSHVF